MSPLKIGVVLDSLDLPAWKYAVLEDLRQQDGISLALLILTRSAIAANGKKAEASNGALPESLAFKVLCKLDRAIFGRRIRANAAAIKNAREIFRDVPAIGASALENGFEKTELGQSLPPRPELDLVLDLSASPAPLAVAGAAKFGSMRVNLGDTDRYRGGPAVFWEMYEKDPVLGVQVERVANEYADSEVVCRAYVGTKPFSLLLNRNEISWKAAAVLTHEVLRLRDRGQSAVHGCSDGQLVRAKQYLAPTVGEIAKFGAAAAAGMVRSRFQSTFYRESWFLAFAERGIAKNGSLISHGPFHTVQPPRGHFYADPCVVTHEGHSYMFFEDFVFATRRGHVGCIEFDVSTGAVIRNQTVLQEPYHLSYPFVFEVDGEFFMIPESAADGTIRLYRAANFPWEWELDSVLLEGVKAVDATVHREYGLFWMFFNLPYPGGTKMDHLYLYYAENIRGPWRSHPENPVVLDVRRTRPAGALFRVGGKLYRPAQDTSVSYGNRITINAVETLTTTKYCERKVSEIRPQWLAADNLRTHTLSMTERIVVTDGLHQVRK